MAKKKKPTPRKRRSPQKNPPKKKNRSLRIVLIFLAMAALVALGYLLGTGQYKQFLPKPQAIQKHKPKPKQKPKSKPTIVVKEAPKSTDNMTILDLLKYGEMEDAKDGDIPEISWYEPGQHDTAHTPDANQSTTGKTATTKPDQIHPSTGKRPKLAIIIDDVSHKRQLDTIKSLPYHITPSIFPPSELSANSNKLADHTKHFMVHLPMESGSVAMNRMRGMLFVRDSSAKVQKRVDDIRKLFPRAKFVNNHTGSVFTSNYKAMKQLYSMMHKKGLVFIDSRTSRKSKVRKIAKEFGDTYIARDVFLDNVQDESLILKQLKKAVRVARKRGFAIAIGHPHPTTMRALKHASKILSGVQTVYIDELYR
jgi:polysaccharide deacetylase 2 family uncharacterized protein YibQ